MSATDQSLDAFLAGRIELAQFRNGHHRGGTDGVLAAMAGAAIAADQAARLGRTVQALDMGAGSGLIGIGLAAVVPQATVTLVERDPALAELCAANIQRNRLTERGRVIGADVLAPALELAALGLVAESQDLVVTNPPWFAPGAVRASPGAGRRAAHVFDAAQGAGGEALQHWLRCACRLLRPGGVLLVIHRADALPHILGGMARRFGDVRVAPVAARPGEPAIRVLACGVRGRRGPFVLDAPLTLHGPDGRFADSAARAHAGAPLPWGSWGAGMIAADT